MKQILIRSVLSLPFVAAALPLLVNYPGQTILTLPFGWVLTDAGLLRFASLVLKSWVSVQAAILLSSTTSLPDLLLALRFLHLPALLVAVMGMMWRYLELMINEVQRMLRARAARSGSQPGGRRSGGSLWWRSQVAGGMAGSLMVRSLERSERVYAAMLARGYDGEVRSLPRPALNRRQKWILLSGGLVLGLAALLGNMIWK